MRTRIYLPVVLHTDSRKCAKTETGHSFDRLGVGWWPVTSRFVTVKCLLRSREQGGPYPRPCPRSGGLEVSASEREVDHVG